MYRFLVATILVASLFIQSCSKKSDDTNNNPGNGGNQGPVETSTLKYIPDSMFRVYLKNNVCPDAFDNTGKLIDITHSEVKNFTGAMQIDTITCPAPYVSSLKGVEYFTSMKKLIVQNSALDSLDLSATMALDTLKLVGDIDLQYVTVSGCTSMRFIKVSHIPTTSLNLANLPALNYISLATLTRLSELKTDNDANLQHIIGYGLTSLSTVNVSGNPALRRLYLQECTGLNALDVTHNQKLSQLVTTYCPSFKRIDLSKNDSLSQVSFEGSGIDSVDFSHNPQLFSIIMMWTPLRNLSLLANPKVQLLWLDGCAALQNLDLRAQTHFDFYYVDHAKVNFLDEDLYQTVQNGLFSPVQTPDYPIFSPATRKGVNGATQDLFGGLRVPNYLDVGSLSLVQIKINDAVKDNYSLVMARRVLSSMTPVLVTVYAADQATVVCNDYDPTLFKCN